MPACDRTSPRIVMILDSMRAVVPTTLKRPWIAQALELRLLACISLGHPSHLPRTFFLPVYVCKLLCVVRDRARAPLSCVLV